MAPTLYWLPHSPPARSVFLCAKALEIDLKLQVLDLFKYEQFTPEYLKICPQHTIPTLEEEDGFVLIDSHAIMTYLVGKYGKDKSLYPVDLKKRSIVDHRLHFDSSVLYLRGLVIARGICIEGAKEITAYQKQQLREAFEIAETFLESNKWVAGDELTVADFCFVTSITAWAIFEPLVEAKYPRIISWLKEMEKLPYYKTANEPGLDECLSYLQSKLPQ